MKYCDFCFRRPVTLYPTPDFMIPETNGLSQGDWAACRVCARLVDGNRWEELLDRSMVAIKKHRKRDGHGELDPALERGLRKHLRLVLRTFREHLPRKER